MQALVGAEWWALAIDADDATVGFHWDLDYEAEDRLHVHRYVRRELWLHLSAFTYCCARHRNHVVANCTNLSICGLSGEHSTPYAATVTYLCNAGVPTLILDKAPTASSRDGPLVRGNWVV